MSTSYNSFCDEFYLDMHVNTEMDLPADRDTLLAFFERVQRHYPTMGNFYRGESGEYCLEENQESGEYRWVSVENDRVGSGMVSPSNVEQVYTQDKLVLELIPYMLGVNHLDIDSLDITYGMDFDFQGNHDEIIAEALFASTAFGCLLDLPHSKPLSFSPTILTALSEDCRTQARITVESKTSAFEIRNQKYKPEEAISLYFTIRQYPRPDEKFDAVKSFGRQCAMAEELMATRIMPQFVQPLTNAIAQRR
ncbi:MAG: hypothetical protein Q7T18_05645 [Sedimentisphaerales bacterium]|nr:hypothetical protein [Sedimentisphaerales bacterium]